MRSNRSSVLIIWLVICMMSLGNYGVFAGSLDAPGGPESPLSAMYSLESVYNRLDTGEAGSKRTGGFTEPSAGPAPTRHNLNEIMDKAPTVDAVNGATNTEVLAGQTYWGLQSGAWGTQTGTLATVTLSADNDTVNAGNYAATTLSAVDTDLATNNIKSGVTIFGFEGDPNVVDTSSGDAVAGDMLSGKIAYVDGSQVTGNVAAGGNVSGADGSKTFTITDGLYSGNKTATAIDTDLTAGNIKDSVTIFGVTGTFTGGGGTPTNAYVGKTGQTTSYRTGDDGDLEEGIAWPSPRFTDLGNRIRDNLTGLEWTENANLAGGTKSWDDAVEYCNSLTVDTLTDWRLPNRFELESLLDLANVGPALPSGHPFDNVQNNYYWSSTAYADYPAYAWYVYMRYGHVDAGSRGDSYYVWPVRGGQ